MREIEHKKGPSAKTRQTRRDLVKAALEQTKIPKTEQRIPQKPRQGVSEVAQVNLDSKVQESIDQTVNQPKKKQRSVHHKQSKSMRKQYTSFTKALSKDFVTNAYLLLMEKVSADELKQFGSKLIEDTVTLEELEGARKNYWEVEEEKSSNQNEQFLDIIEEATMKSDESVLLDDEEGDENYSQSEVEQLAQDSEFTVSDHSSYQSSQIQQSLKNLNIGK
eukprot:403338869